MMAHSHDGTTGLRRLKKRTRPIRLGVRSLAIGVLALVAAAGCESSPDALDGELEFSVFHRSLQTGAGSGVDSEVVPIIRMRVRAGVPAREIDRLRSFVMRWPGDSHSEAQLVDFKPDASGGWLAEFRPSFWDEPLPPGIYTYDAIGVAGQLLFEGDWEAPPDTWLEPVIARSYSQREDGVDLNWTSPAQPHEWSLSLQQTIAGAVTEVGTGSMGQESGGPAELEASVTGVVWDAEATYQLVMELHNESNERTLRQSLLPPTESDP